MDVNALIYDENIRPIDRIEFNIWRNEEIKKISALGKDSSGIEIPELYDNMEPKRGGLIDTRLGVVGSTLECATCGFDAKNCIGHFGHIDLAEPVFHIGFIEQIKKILSCVCLKCSKLLIHKNEDEILESIKNKHGKSRFNEIRNITKNVTHCMKPGYGCGTPVTKIKIEKKKSTAVINIISELQTQTDEVGQEPGKKIIKQILSPEICYDILKNISDRQLYIFHICAHFRNRAFKSGYCPKN